MFLSAISALTSAANSSSTDTTSAITHAQRKHQASFNGDFATAATDAFRTISSNAVGVSNNVASALNNLKPQG